MAPNEHPRRQGGLAGREPSGARGAGRPGRAPTVPAPPIPADVVAADLPREVLAELREFPPDRRDTLARHLVAAGALLEAEPDAAYQHAAYVRRSAGRLASVREAAGVAAYRSGRYAEALSDLRAYTRMTGDPRHLPVMADCERGLGRPERALALARGTNAARLGRAEQIELRIVASGARRDLGEPEAALVELRGPDLDSTQVSAWTPRLWYAYAEALLAAGQPEEAIGWFTSAAAVDSYGETDAERRVADLGPGLAE